MGKLAATLYGVFCYAFFLVAFLYAIGFVEDAVVPKTIDSGPSYGLASSVGVDLVLLGLFALQHSGMARQEFKRWWTKYVPSPIERSTYVLISSLVLVLLFVYWRPLPDNIWSVGEPWTVVLWALSGVGWLMVLGSTFLISHFDLFGLKQVWAFQTGKDLPEPQFYTPLLYKFVRHPLYLGFILAFWATPVMSTGHLIFAIMTTAYILVAIQFEERDLVAVFGKTYEDYQKRVSMIVPWFPKKASSAPKGKAAKG
jgi:protein-S-isoprenylcysteine O-methyltransferase Ste14